MIVVLVVSFLVGSAIGWFTDSAIMGLGVHGFWLGLLAVALCTLTIAVAGWIEGFAAARVRIFPTSGVVALSMGNGFVCAGAAALGYALGAAGLGLVWLGVVFAVLLVLVAAVASRMFVRWVVDESLENARWAEYESRPIVMDVDAQGHVSVYKRPY